MSASNLDSRGGAENPKVKDVRAVSLTGKMSRSDSDDGLEGAGSLLYFANFEDNQGFAILAADDRISCDVIGVSESGNISQNSLPKLEVPERYMFPGYPKYGPGFYTLSEYPGELFMNPNTVNLFIKEEGDTLVGNFDIAADSLKTTSIIGGNLTPFEPNPNSTSPQDIISTLSLLYAYQELSDYETRKKDRIYGNDADLGISESGGGLTVTNVEKEIVWTVLPDSNVSPLLEAFKKWHQGHPFNYYSPDRLNIKFKAVKAKAGCFPLAIAKIMAYYEHPAGLRYYLDENSYIPINWSLVKQPYSNPQYAGALLKHIADGCGSWFFAGGTFTFPNKAQSYMRNVANLGNISKSKYSFDLAKTSLDAGKPIIMYGLPGININEAHAWNLDGYRVEKRSIIYKYYSGSVLLYSRIYDEDFNMVHCNFGWYQMEGNGYYVSGIFNLKDKLTVDLDPGSGKGENNYNFHIRMITHTGPN